MPDDQAAVRATREDRGKAVQAQHNAAKRSKARTNVVKNGVIVLMGAGLAWTIYNNNRLAEKALGKEVVYVSLLASGEILSSAHYSEIASVSQSTENVQNSLWTYVQARDCFNLPNASRQFYIAQAMSDQRVGMQVRQSLDPKVPTSATHIYGDKGITVQCDAVDPPTLQGDAGDIFYFRFRRWEEKGRPATAADIAAAPIYSVAVRFRTGIFPADPRRAWLDRTTFNAQGVQVIDYPGAQPTNARPPSKVSLSSAGDTK